MLFILPVVVLILLYYYYYYYNRLQKNRQEQQTIQTDQPINDCIQLESLFSPIIVPQSFIKELEKVIEDLERPVEPTSVSFYHRLICYLFGLPLRQPEHPFKLQQRQTRAVLLKLLCFIEQLQYHHHQQKDRQELQFGQRMKDLESSMIFNLETAIQQQKEMLHLLVQQQKKKFKKENRTFFPPSPTKSFIRKRSNTSL